MVNTVIRTAMVIEKMILLIKKPSCIFPQTTNGALVVGLFILSYIVGQKLHLMLICKIIENIIAVLIPMMIYLALFDRYLQSFSHKSYLIGILLLATFSTLVLGRIFGIQIKIFTSVFFLNLSVYSIWWFCYHVVAKRTLLKNIKVRLKFYLAIGGLLSYILLLLDIKYFEIAIASMLMSFAWITYFIEAFEQEEEQRGAAL